MDLPRHKLRSTPGKRNTGLPLSEPRPTCPGRTLTKVMVPKRMSSVVAEKVWLSVPKAANMWMPL